MELDMQKIEQWKNGLERDGFLAIEDLLPVTQLEQYRRLYDDIRSGQVDVSRHRHDLGSHVATGRENICQVMWPSLYLSPGQTAETVTQSSVLHRTVVSLARSLLGPDMDFDFDMLISKEGGSTVETPWHQDESYWLDLPDKRALSFWFPMEDAKIENGCMWFIAGSHKGGLREHRPVAEGHHVRMTEDVDPSLATPCPVPVGGCTVHTGRTLHYTGPNSTATARRAYIINCRPGPMVRLEREQQYDHGRQGLDGIITTAARAQE